MRCNLHHYMSMKASFVARVGMVTYILLDFIHHKNPIFATQKNKGIYKNVKREPKSISVCGYEVTYNFLYGRIKNCAMLKSTNQNH